MTFSTIAVKALRSGIAWSALSTSNTGLADRRAACSAAAGVDPKLVAHHFGTKQGLFFAVVELPFLNEAFGTHPLSATDWLICIGLASCVLWAGEARKLVARLLRRP